jgi:hypothetical protein
MLVEDPLEVMGGTTVFPGLEKKVEEVVPAEQNVGKTSKKANK